ncbi:MAG: zinc ABC transporter solute-binding protein [Silicimonas sp.]|nr:zinc ABC transporter solute-binding protein [Silicimonas sp.]
MRTIACVTALCLAFPLAARADAPRVLTDIAPVRGLVARVMDGVGAPDILLPASGTVHSYDLRPSEAARLESADVVFWVGPSLTPWLSRPIATLADDAAVVSLLDAENLDLLSFREANGHDGEDHDHDHDGESDPHAWLDPANAALWLEVIAETLSATDPVNADRYRANAADGGSEIAKAAATVAERLGEPGQIRYLMYHDAMQYFENRFGLKPVGFVTAGDAAAPGPAGIEHLQKRVDEGGTECLLVEPQENDALVAAFAERTGMRIVRIDPLGLDLPVNADFYPALLASLADSFESCR